MVLVWTLGTLQHFPSEATPTLTGGAGTPVGSTLVVRSPDVEPGILAGANETSTSPTSTLKPQKDTAPTSPPKPQKDTTSAPTPTSTPKPRRDTTSAPTPTSSLRNVKMLWMTITSAAGPRQMQSSIECASPSPLVAKWKLMMRLPGSGKTSAWDCANHVNKNVRCA